MTEQDKAYAEADLYRTLVSRRTGLKRDELECPREKSFMTPCLARDGGLAVAFDSFNHALCVGCESHLEGLLKTESEKPFHSQTRGEAQP